MKCIALLLAAAALCSAEITSYSYSEVAPHVYTSPFYYGGLEKIYSPFMTRSIAGVPVMADVPVVAKAFSEVPVMTKAYADVPVMTKTIADVPVMTKTIADVPVMTKTIADVPVMTKTIADVPVMTKTIADVPVVAKTYADVPFVAKAYTGVPFAAAPLTTYVAPRLAAYTPVVAAPMKSQYHSQEHHSGVSAYGHSEVFQSHDAVQDSAGNKVGSFSQVYPDGSVAKTDYVADSLGYRVASNNLPVHVSRPVVDTIEVAAAKAAHFAEVEKVKARGKRDVAFASHLGYSSYVHPYSTYAKSYYPMTYSHVYSPYVNRYHGYGLY